MLNDEQKILDFFSQFISEKTGIVYRPDNYYQLERRLLDTALQLGFENIDDFYNRYKTGIYGPARSLLLDVSTNNETLFFRDRNVFKAFKHLINEIPKDKISNINIWSAASSTGQEAYSLAMLLEEWKTANSLRNYNIQGTDISDRVLEKARAGNYTQLEVQRGLPANLMVKWFEQKKTSKDSNESAQNWQISSELQKNVRFNKFNLIKDLFPIEKYDFVFCRNVLIYFDVETKAEVVKKLHKSLKPDGYLILGGSESLVGINSDFEKEKIESTYYYRKIAEDSLNKKSA